VRVSRSEGQIGSGGWIGQSCPRPIGMSPDAASSHVGNPTQINEQTMAAC